MQAGKRQLNLLGVLSKDNLSQTILKFTDKTFLNQQNVQKTFQQFVRKIVWKQNNGWTESFIVRSEHKNHLRQIAHWAMPNEIFENPHFALNMTLVHKITFCVQSCLEANHPIVLEEAQWTNKVVAAADDQGGALVWTHQNTVL